MLQSKLHILPHERNIVTKIKRKSIRNYFLERCVGDPKNKDFWPKIKPFLTNKGCNCETDITQHV
jgi:hypothetical protein